MQIKTLEVYREFFHIFIYDITFDHIQEIECLSQTDRIRIST